MVIHEARVSFREVSNVVVAQLLSVSLQTIVFEADCLSDAFGIDAAMILVRLERRLGDS